MWKERKAFSPRNARGPFASPGPIPSIPALLAQLLRQKSQWGRGARRGGLAQRPWEENLPEATERRGENKGCAAKLDYVLLDEHFPWSGRRGSSESGWGEDTAAATSLLHTLPKTRSTRPSRTRFLTHGQRFSPAHAS